MNIKKNIAVLLPPPPFDDNNLEIFSNKLYKKFGESTVVFYARNKIDDINYYKNIDTNFIWIDESGIKDITTNIYIKPDVVIVVKNKFGAILMHIDKIVKNLTKFDYYYFDSVYHSFYKVNKNNTLLEGVKRHSHVFDKMAYNTQKELAEYVYSPYGYYVRQPFSDEVNEFGFRVSYDYMRLAERKENHKVIAVFGGSAAYGVLVPQEQSFCFLLEKMLNEKEDGNTYSVLNFGMPSYVLLNELITYLVFVQNLRPDTVISYSGYNDLHHGILTDEYLLKNFDINYSIWQEGWAAKLRGEEYILPDSWYINKDKSVQPIVDSFILRNRQFRSLVEGQNSRFIFALQPFWGSKNEHSDEEEESFADCHKRESNQPLVSALEYLYGKLKKTFLKKDIDVDFDDIFCSINKNESVFGDICHLNKNGERLIAQHLYYMITECASDDV